MGHDHEEPYKIPDYRIYKVEDVPLLMQTQRALASQGLRDPWLRNEVWRYNEEVFGTQRSRTIKLFTRGFKLGFAAFVATMVVTKIYETVYPPKHEHDDDHH